MVGRPKDEKPSVVVIDDDQGTREALKALFRSVDLDAELFGSVQEFLASNRPDKPGCMLLDVRLPGRSGLDFQDEMQRTKTSLPIIFMTGHGDIPMTVRAIKAGAIEFLTKPFSPQRLLDAVQTALEIDRSNRLEAKELNQIIGMFDALSNREREVMGLVVSGLMNKQIAGQLGLSEVTIKLHRGQVMKKMRARSLAELVKISERIKPKMFNSS